MQINTTLAHDSAAVSQGTSSGQHILGVLCMKSGSPSVSIVVIC